VTLISDFARRLALTIRGVEAFEFVFGWVLKDAIWSGRWRITWTVASPTFNNTNAWEGRIARCFDTIVARGVGVTSGGVTLPYGFVGKLSPDHSLLTGTWFDERGAKSGYHGAYQLRLTPVGDQAIGKWLGFSKTQPVINSGDLLWEKL